MRTREAARKLGRWAPLAIAMAVAALYLNSAAYSVWAVNEPATRAPEWWLQRAFAHLCYSGVALALGLASFLAVRRLKRASAILAAVALLLAAMPRVRAFRALDGCLDGGGRWDARTFRCER